MAKLEELQRANQQLALENKKLRALKPQMEAHMRQTLLEVKTHAERSDAELRAMVQRAMQEQEASATKWASWWLPGLPFDSKVSESSTLHVALHQRNRVGLLFLAMWMLGKAPVELQKSCQEALVGMIKSDRNGEFVFQM